MALKERIRKLNAIRYVCRQDSAVDEEKSDRETYQKDPVTNADCLLFKEGEEPTVFILNFEPNAKETAMINDLRVDTMRDSRGATMTLGSWALAVCRYCIKGIENPPNIKPFVEFKKDGRGYIADSVLDKLSQVGVVDEVWALYISMRESLEVEKAELKNS
jgi:hypothetical protein